jgi:catechol 2,3-dioxygenase-like lactoylglutathione lyase family enzyme
MGPWTKRLTQLSLVACAAALPLSRQSPLAAQTSPVEARSNHTALVTAVRGVEMVVSDIHRSRAFFEMLGFTLVREQELSGPDEERRTGIAKARVRRLELALGSEHLALRQFIAPGQGRPIPPDSRGNDLWFQHVAIVVRDMDRAYGWLRAHHVAHVSSGPQTLPQWNESAAGIQAFYFADPDGHVLELIHFPAGKGDSRWQTPPACNRTPAELCQFLGIDHTAMTVSDTDASLAFYRDRLGLRLAGESENYGTEQEHLNGVFGARLRITTLRAGSGPSVELLEYLSPRGGRAARSDARANDLTHWQIDLAVFKTAAVWAAANASGGRGITQTTSGREALVRDRDGHALLAAEPSVRE